MKRTFDELNYTEYFSTMPITEKQKKDRIKAAQEFEDIFLYFIIMVDIADEKAVKDFTEKYTEIVSKYNSNDEFIGAYVALLATEVAETTLKHKGDEYYTSFNRAQLLSANAANSVLNQTDFDNAKVSGYTKKRWRTELDNKVRPTHAELEGVTIPIDDLFVVGNSVMRYPHDYEMCEDMSELSNCRCALSYIR